MGMLGMSLFFGGCGNAQRDATEAAVNAAQTAINAATNTAERYVPEQTKAAQDAAKKAKDALSAASAKKEEWTNTWNSLNQALPRTMNEIQAKMNAYAKSGKLPKGVDQSQMEEAKAQLEKNSKSFLVFSKTI